MISTTFNRRDFSLGLAAFFSGLGLVGTAFASSAPRRGPLAGPDEVSHAGEAIHQEVIFQASRKRVYEALTDAKQFSQVVQLSAAGMSYGNAPVEVSREVGGAFSLFGGYISGRHIELVPSERIVEAWRTGSWPAGVFSIAKFALTDQGPSTKLILDHTGFPAGAGKSLAEGWHANYWEPLAKFLAK
jgi:uncharacterized protein YndB with AHSA1/START domain